MQLLGRLQEETAEMIWAIMITVTLQRNSFSAVLIVLSLSSIAWLLYPDLIRPGGALTGVYFPLKLLLLLTTRSYL